MRKTKAQIELENARLRAALADLVAQSFTPDDLRIFIIGTGGRPLDYNENTRALSARVDRIERAQQRARHVLDGGGG